MEMLHRVIHQQYGTDVLGLTSTSIRIMLFIFYYNLKFGKKV